MLLCSPEPSVLFLRTLLLRALRRPKGFLMTPNSEWHLTLFEVSYTTALYYLSVTPQSKLTIHHSTFAFRFYFVCLFWKEARVLSITYRRSYRTLVSLILLTFLYRRDKIFAFEVNIANWNLSFFPSGISIDDLYLAPEYSNKFASEKVR